MLVLVLPLLSFGLLWAIFRQGTPVDLPVAVCDGDRSPLSRKLIRMVDATRSMRVAFEVADAREGNRLIEEGRAYALILLPDGLEHGVLRGAAPTVVGFYNAEWILPGSLISRDIRTVVGTLSGGIDLRTRQKRGESYAAARAHLEPVRLDARALFNPQLNYLYYLLTALLPTMLQVFITVMAVHAVAVELKDGTARGWMESAGGSLARALAGKLLPYAVGHAVIAMFMITLLYRYLGAPLRGSFPAVFLGTILFVGAYQAMGVLMTAWSRSLRFGTSVAAFYTSPAFAFVGVTFPTMGMPAFARFWGALLPLTHYLRLMVERGTRGAPLRASIPEMLTLLAFCVVAPLLAWRGLRRAVLDPACWGRG